MQVYFSTADLYCCSALGRHPMVVTIDDIRAAADRIKGRVLRSPCDRSAALHEATGIEIYCKLESLQRTGSFKERGACNALQLLSTEQQRRGVIAASAGNHALGLAYHGKQLGVPVVVVMPTFAPMTKVGNCRRFGAEVVLHGRNLAEARREADHIAKERGLTYINGFNDPAIIAGQGTIGLEILEQLPDVEAVLVPIGGAGLIAGIALAIKSLKPDVQMIGVEPVGAASFRAATAAGHPVAVQLKSTLADGLAVPKVGDNAFAIAAPRVDRTVLVEEHDIALAILRLLELQRTVVEGAGAVPLAACLAGLVPELKGRKVVLPLCGANIDTNILGRVLERGLASDGRLCRITAHISDRPGGLAEFAKVIAEAGASFMDIVHDRAFASDDVTLVRVHCTLETRDHEHIQALTDRLREEGFQAWLSQ